MGGVEGNMGDLGGRYEGGVGRVWGIRGEMGGLGVMGWFEGVVGRVWGMGGYGGVGEWGS